jgi:uncharacterized protein YcbK (DUF882 family)
VDVTRRNFLRIGAIAAAQLVVPAVAMARTTVQLRRRSLKFYALHTGESLSTTYWQDGSYIPGELDRVNYILRDFRANEVKPIDPALLDLLTRIQYRLGTNEPFQVISGYRSPVTNAMLHANSEGVAVHSLHLEGKAIDICVPGRSLAQLRGAALAQRSGGVGYYPKSNFVHVDTGRIRFW